MGKKIILGIVLLVILTWGSILMFKPKLIFEELLITEVPDDCALIYGKHTIGQVITPRFSNLCKLGFFIFQDNNSAKPDLILHIKSAFDAKNDILRLSVKGPELYSQHRYPFMAPQINTKEGFVYFFELEPLKYEVGKPLYFYLEAPGAMQDSAIKIGCRRNIFRRGYAGGSTYFNGMPWNKYLAFQNYYKLDKGIFVVLNEIKAKVLQDRAFAIFYFSLCILLLIGIAFVTYKEKLLRK